MVGSFVQCIPGHVRVPVPSRSVMRPISLISVRRADPTHYFVFFVFVFVFLAEMKRLFGVFTLLACGAWHMLQL